MVWISVAWIAYEMYFKVTDQYNEKWQYDWITSDFWCVATPTPLCALLCMGRANAFWAHLCRRPPKKSRVCCSACWERLARAQAHLGPAGLDCSCQQVCNI